ncbi:MAG TPA: arginase family protein, partial [Tabrizicola sp.]|nr:arginase family protein [Tabrizicola sp.]
MALEDAKTEVDTAFTRKSNRGYAFENAFGGATSFLRRTYTKDLTGVDLAITGVPFDQAVTHRAGTRFGPRAIREVSTLQAYDPPSGWPTSPLEEMTVIDYGDLAFDYAKVSDFPEALTAHIRTILAAGAGTVTLGGDNYITLPILKAYAETFGRLTESAHLVFTGAVSGAAFAKHGTSFETRISVFDKCRGGERGGITADLARSISPDV